MFVLLAALFFLGARMSHELHDDAGALGGFGCAMTHGSKVSSLQGAGNTAFRVEFFQCEGRRTRYGQRGAFFEG